jgi:hypothetical protein
MVGWVKQAPESEHHPIPTEYYLWARNITRSAKKSLSDRVVVISLLAFDFAPFDFKLRQLVREHGMNQVTPQIPELL